MLFSLETIKVRRVVLIRLGVLLLFIGVLFSFTDEASNEISIPNLERASVMSRHRCEACPK